MDSYEGDNQDPRSLHKYSFSNNSPVNFADPSGNASDASGMGGGIDDVGGARQRELLRGELDLKEGLLLMPDDVIHKDWLYYFGESSKSGIDENQAIGATVANRIFYNRIFNRPIRLTFNGPLYNRNLPTTVLDVIKQKDKKGRSMYQAYGGTLWKMLM